MLLLVTTVPIGPSFPWLPRVDSNRGHQQQPLATTTTIVIHIVTTTETKMDKYLEKTWTGANGAETTLK